MEYQGEDKALFKDFTSFTGKGLFHFQLYTGELEPNR